MPDWFIIDDLPSQIFVGILVSWILAILVFLLNTARRIWGSFNRWRDQKTRDNYQKGWKIMTGEDGKELTKLLLSYYAGPSSANLVSLAYEFENREYRDLPLITTERLMKLIKATKIRCEFSLHQPFRYEIPRKTFKKEEEFWQKIGINIWNASIYSLYKLDSKNPIVEFVSCSQSDDRFRLYRATYGSLSDELADSLAKYGIDKLRSKRKKINKYWKKRQRYLGTADDIVSLNGDSYYCNRICAGGILALFAVDIQEGKNKDTAIIIQRRSKKVSDEPGVYAVVPKAFHGFNIDSFNEVDLEYSVYRECYEELFGGDDKPAEPGYVIPQFYKSLSPAMKDLMEKKGNNRDLKPLGIFWDLILGNFHVPFILHVKDPAWWTTHKDLIKVNWEVDEDVTPVIMLSETDKIIELLQEKKWASDSFFTFTEGLRWLCQNKETQEAKKILRLLPKLKLNPLKTG